MAKPINFDIGVIETSVQNILRAIGEDPDREGLRETPQRVGRFWLELMHGYNSDERIGTTFDAIQTDQMVIIRDVRVWSLCEHHLLPFWCDVSIGYLAQDKVLGLSKLARIAHKHAGGLNLQEGLVTKIAKEISERAETEDVAVLATGEHLCLTMRGARTPHRMISSSLHGRFREAEVRAEFMSLANQGEKR